MVETQEKQLPAGHSAPSLTPEQSAVISRIAPFIGSYKECFFDSNCGEPIAWGYQILRRMSDDDYADVRRHFAIEYAHDSLPACQFIIVKLLSYKEVVDKYGEQTDLVLGPRGGFKSVTFGSKRFISRLFAKGVGLVS